MNVKQVNVVTGEVTTRACTTEEEAAFNLGRQEALDNLPIDIKSEAQRRINLIAPDWKQRNMIARSVELTEKIASGGTLTTAEQSERTTIENVWSQVKTIRTRSDQLEVSKPTDYTNDSHWT